MKSKNIVILALVLILLSFMGIGIQKKVAYEKKEYTGIPDLVSTSDFGVSCHGIILAKAKSVPDKEEFARTVAQMVQENSFHTIRFSTDLKELPRNLNFDVYLNRKEFEKGNLFCTIEYRAVDENDNMEITDTPKQYVLTVDDVVIKL